MIQRRQMIAPRYSCNNQTETNRSAGYINISATARALTVTNKRPLDWSVSTPSLCSPSTERCPSIHTQYGLLNYSDSFERLQFFLRISSLRLYLPLSWLKYFLSRSFLLFLLFCLILLQDQRTGLDSEKIFHNVSYYAIHLDNRLGIHYIAVLRWTELFKINEAC